MAITGDYLGMKLDIADLDVENLEFFKHCAARNDDVVLRRFFVHAILHNVHADIDIPIGEQPFQTCHHRFDRQAMIERHHHPPALL